MEFVRTAVFVIFFSSFASGLTCYKYSATFEVSSQQWKSVAKPTTEQCKKEAVGCQLIMTPRTDGNKNLIGVSSYGACAAKPNDSSLGCEMEDLFIEQAGVQTGNCICTQDNCNLALALKWMPDGAAKLLEEVPNVSMKKGPINSCQPV